MTVYFDMDGTIANLYSVENWLPKLQNSDASPYKEATPLINFSLLARLLNKFQSQGNKIGIVSWTAKNASKEYKNEIAETKKKWLSTHLKSVKFDEVKIGEFGTPKSQMVDDKDGILFDDEVQNRDEWKGIAFNVDNIIEILKALILLNGTVEKA